MITWSDAYLLGWPAMDDTHREFVDLLAAVEAADDAALVAAWQALVEHTAQRNSHRRMQHLAWHLRSLWRLWCSPAWRHRPRH